MGGQNVGSYGEAHEVYGRMAASYAETNPGNPARAEYEWPAVRDLLPELEGEQVLDAGCGTGHYSAWLTEQGAEVTGLDASREMLDVAADRHPEVARYLQADLREPLSDLDDGEFDLVVSQLTLEHVEDWSQPMAEFARVLKPGGVLVFSCDHPFTTYFVIEHEGPEIGNDDVETADYYEIERYNRMWPHGDEPTPIPCYRRPLRGVVGPVFEAGFVLEDLREPKPPETDAPFAYFRSHTPRFLIVRAHRTPTDELAIDPPSSSEVASSHEP